MAKWVGFITRRENLTPEEFLAHWTGPHAAIASRLPKLRGYSINLLPENSGIGWDGFVELWFDSDEDLLAALASDVMKFELPLDRPKFIGRMISVAAQEYPIIEMR